MEIQESGVLRESRVYFHTASLTAQRLFFTLTCTGRYICGSNYLVRRPSYDSYLILYVVRGKGFCELGGRRTPLPVGSMAILDCHAPHCYGTSDSWEILWAHFDGRMAADYFDAIAGSGRQIIQPKNGYPAARALESIYQMFHVDKRVSEAMISRHITVLLTEFLMYEMPQQQRREQSVQIEAILGYINEHLDQSITLESLAQRASMSPFHFSRVFKRETGYTLREYLINTRINAACYYLRTTQMPLKEITGRCGYAGESTFCTVFKRITGMTPQAYRHQKEKIP